MLACRESEVSGVTAHGYNEHGEIETQTDARGVTMSRTLDALDRVSFLDYPDDTLDITYTYDDPLVAFSKGRLTRIELDGHAVDYRYDPWGRTTQDGQLGYVLDANGNREEIEYPGGVIAHYTHDYADREATLAVEVPGEPVQAIVTASSYLPAGPLEELTLGNGLEETHLYDSRYFPDRITVAGTSPLLDWDYTVDKVGNPTLISDVLNPTQNRVYGYQDYQYYLTLGNGPWGNLSWAYDRIGNRLRETRDGVQDVYSYVPNAAGGRTAKLDEIALGAGGVREYSFDASGNQTQAAQGADVVDMIYDDASRLAKIDRPSAGVYTDLLYDGRGYLRDAEEVEPALILRDGFESGNAACWSSVVGGAGGGVCPETSQVEPIYSSEGALHHQLKPAGVERAVVYFAGRPVAIVELPASGSTKVLLLSTDHLGTPILASTLASGVSWVGGFEPFGADWSGAATAGVFLRFPGQWKDEAWEAADVSETLSYNGQRWYLNKGRYDSVDPLREYHFGIAASEGTPWLPYMYAANRPLKMTDPLGLLPKPSDTSDATYSWCDELPENCNGGCNPLQLLPELVDASNGMIAFCRKVGVAERPSFGNGPGSSVLGSLDQGRPWIRRSGDPCVDECRCEHEERHQDQTPLLIHLIGRGFPDGQILNIAECDAYAAEVTCLINILGQTLRGNR